MLITAIWKRIAGSIAIAGAFLFAMPNVDWSPFEEKTHVVPHVHVAFNSNLADWTLQDAEADTSALSNLWIDQMTTGAVGKAAKRGFKRTGATVKSKGLFGSISIPFSNIVSAPKLNAAKRLIRSTAVLDCGNTAGCASREKRVAGILKRGKKSLFFDKLNLINSTVNELVNYQPDMQTYRKLDHWANPAESLRSGVGDCEDYVILKMALLQKLGVPAKAMSLVVLKDTKRNLYHAVLAVSTNKGTFILDNVQRWVVMDRQLPHYLPLYSFSEKRSWVHGWKKTQKKQLALTRSSDFANIAPGESFAVPPLKVSDINSQDLLDLRPTMAQFSTVSDYSANPAHINEDPWIMAEGSPR